MIQVDSLLYKIDQRLNKVATSDHQQIPLEDKILALNEAQIKLVKTKIDPNNIYKIGLDGFKKRYQDLQFLVENFEDHPLTLTLADPYMNKWIANVEAITPAYMFYLDSYLIADKGNCTNRVIWSNADLVRHADIVTLLLNNNYKPSFEYQETIVDISSDELHFYTDGTFNLSLVYLCYIRYPLPIDKEGYDHFDGSPSQNQNCELESYLEDELLDIVYQDLGMYTENESAVQYSQLKQQRNE
jgi:hypothetical protein